MIKEVGIPLLMCVVMANAVLWWGGMYNTGYTPGNQGFNFVSSQLNITDIDQNNYLDTNSNVLKASDGQPASGLIEQFLAAALTFVENIPILGGLITAFRFIYDIIFYGVFGFTIVLHIVGLPIAIINIMRILIFMIVGFTLLEIMQEFTASRGGSK